ncbi:hypothetical protein MRX96_020821 [Rhipicephalus microplus]
MSARRRAGASIKSDIVTGFSGGSSAARRFAVPLAFDELVEACSMAGAAGVSFTTQQIGELRRQNQTLAREIQEFEAKQVGSSEPVQEAEAEDGDDGSSVISRLTSVSRQDADTVVGPASITGSIGRIKSLRA